ncbi:MAG: CAP domain-containing protein [Candidatus Falkowbacteria bacterium]
MAKNSKKINQSTPKGLKDFFIPHHGNNFHPHSLHPKRIAFHLLGAVAVKAVVVFFVLAFPLSAWLAPEVSVAQGQKIVALTNELRATKAVAKLNQNPKLDQAAYKKTQDMMINQYFAHVSPTNKSLDSWLSSVGYSFTVAGENLAMGYSAAEDTIKTWENSPTHYANLIDPDFSEIGVAMSDGVFEGQNTTLAAQYFARPETIPTFVLAAKAEPVAPKVVARPVKASVVVSKPVGKKEQVVKAVVELPAKTKSANLNLGPKKIPLQKNATSTWSATEIITAPEYDAITEPVILASVSAIDSAGTETVANVSKQDIKPQAVSLADQYQLLKNNPNQNIKKVVGLSSLYFSILMIIVVVSLVLNVFIEIKKQHPSLLLGGVSLIAVLFIFLII